MVEKKNNEVDLIMPDNALNFSVQQNTYKEEIKLHLAKVSSQKNIFTTSNKLKNFGILVTKKEKRIVQKRSMSIEIIDTIIVKEWQQFDKYDKLNPVEI